MRYLFFVILQLTVFFCLRFHIWNHDYPNHHCEKLLAGWIRGANDEISWAESKLFYFLFSISYNLTRRPPLIENKRARQLVGDNQVLVRQVVGVYGDCGREGGKGDGAPAPAPHP
jgi:hypothetical protein